MARLFPPDRMKNHGMNLEEALQGCNRNRSIVLLAHQPRAAKEALDNHKGVGLVLSGTCDIAVVFALNIWIFVIDISSSSYYYYYYCNYIILLLL